jgi:hypothetical protein
MFIAFFSFHLLIDRFPYLLQCYARRTCHDKKRLENDCNWLYPFIACAFGEQDTAGKRVGNNLAETQEIIHELYPLA